MSIRDTFRAWLDRLFTPEYKPAQVKHYPSNVMSIEGIPFGESFEKATLPGSNGYPWDRWLDGEVHYLVHEYDFVGLPENFIRVTVGRRRHMVDGKIEARRVGDQVVRLKYVAPEEAAA